MIKMLEMMMSLVLYILIFWFYYFLMKMLILKKVYLILFSALLALPVLNIKSAFFVFEIYFVLIVLIIYLIMKIFLLNFKKSLLIIILLSIMMSISMVGYGIHNMKNIVKTHYDIETEKNLTQDYRVTVLADLHYPATMHATQLQEIVNAIKKENSDIVMLCGDIVDEYTTDKQRKEVFEILGQLAKTSKVYYVFGNHDTGKYSLNNHISSDDLVDLMKAQGIIALQDEIVQFNDEMTICGRIDDSFHNREDIETLLKGSKQDNYLIMMDHQPKELAINSQNGIDLHLSGHTHSGQLFPLYFIYELFHINELNYGRKQIDQMTAINTSGIAGWGFPVRTENHSEYVVIDIHHKLMKG